jgi:hypothetical protein
MLWFDERGNAYPSNPWFGEILDFLLSHKSYDEQNDVDAYYEFIQAMIDLKVEEPEVRADIALDLYELAIVNPNVLLGIDCNQLPNWQTIAQHIAPASEKGKIINLPSGLFHQFNIQSLDDAGGTRVNMDYYGIKITTMPNDPATGQQFSPDELLDYFRRNINSLVSGSTFEPYCKIPSICQQEMDLWDSSNPLGALIYIDIPLDDGVVVCSEYTNTHWYFMTMNAPYAGNHPVSGVRAFGYESNQDGSYTFFARGADRVVSWQIEYLGYIAGFGNPFSGSDNLWSHFQTNLNSFVLNNSGASNIEPVITERVNREVVKDVLHGNRPVTDLNCYN